jgi:hypothetical protein
MEIFVVCDDLASSSSPLTAAVQALGGKPVNPNCWLVIGPYGRVLETARRTAASRVIVIPSDTWRQYH